MLGSTRYAVNVDLGEPTSPDASPEVAPSERHSSHRVDIGWTEDANAARAPNSVPKLSIEAPCSGRNGRLS